jgi:fumarate reductase flavoprotein subunit
MRDADAIVVGAGAGGLMGALAAAHCGADVLLLERDLAGPSNLRVSGGLFPGAGTKFQRRAAIQDDAELFARDVRAKAGDSANQAILDTVARRTADTVDFLAEKAGLPIHLLSNIVAPGHSVARLHATPAESGRELHAMLRDAVTRHARIRTLDGVEITGLVKEGGLFNLLPGGTARPRCCSPPADSPRTARCSRSSFPPWPARCTSAPDLTTAAPSYGVAGSAQASR